MSLLGYFCLETSFLPRDLRGHFSASSVDKGEPIDHGGLRFVFTALKLVFFRLEVGRVDFRRVQLIKMRRLITGVRICVYSFKTGFFFSENWGGHV